MATKKYDVVAITGEYTNAAGEVKKRYLNCGVVFEKDGKLSLKLEAVPVVTEGWFQLFEPRSQGQNYAQQSQGGNGPEGDIPF